MAVCAGGPPPRCLGSNAGAAGASAWPGCSLGFGGVVGSGRTRSGASCAASGGAGDASRVSSGAGMTWTVTTSVCHSRGAKYAEPTRMIRLTASSTTPSETKKGRAAWISSRDRRPQRKKSFTRSSPVCSRQKASAMASATWSTPTRCRRCVGSGKSGRLFGIRARPSVSILRGSSLGRGCPVQSARTVAQLGTRSAAKTSPRSSALISGGQAPTRSMDLAKVASSRLRPTGSPATATSLSWAIAPRLAVSVSRPQTSCRASRMRRREFWTRLFSQYRLGSMRSSPFWEHIAGSNSPVATP
mmetsp:Transcript_57912/g.125902  ORF Transcript_57912/g.125902 Transcript_57912/m.125902 type:complete len:301 (-) Transcript_57912:187-1089(-)